MSPKLRSRYGADRSKKIVKKPALLFFIFVLSEACHSYNDVSLISKEVKFFWGKNRNWRSKPKITSFWSIWVLKKHSCSSLGKGRQWSTDKEIDGRICSKKLMHPLKAQEHMHQCELFGCLFPLPSAFLLAWWLKANDSHGCQQQEEIAADFMLSQYWETQRNWMLRLLTYVVETDFRSMQTEMHNLNKVMSQTSSVFIENIPDV